MKNLIFVFACLFSVSVFGQTVYTEDQVYCNDYGLLFEKSNDLPISGIVQDYYESGQLESEGIYKDGIEEGLAKYYYENGQLESEGMLYGPFEAGYWTYYYENGQLSQEGNYKEGKAEGLYKMYHQNGQLSHEIYYVDFDVDYENCWDESGTEITCED